MSPTKENNPFVARHATPADLPSLTTIVPRSFHPTNPYIKNMWPNTPQLQTWWHKVFASKIASSSSSTSTSTSSHLLTASSTSNPPESSGLLSMQLFGRSERGAGFYTDPSLPPTTDHDATAYADVAAGLTGAREEMMMGREHFVIELFGVDHGAKGYGLGMMLLRKACEIADEAGLPIFVMANASAQGIYPKVGFELREVKVLPGELKYEEFMLVRPAKGGS